MSKQSNNPSFDLENISMSKLKMYISDIDEAEYKRIRPVLEADSRKSVQAILKSKDRQIDKQKQEAARMISMFSYEDDARKKGFNCIVGIDEAGRGPLVGDVVAAVAMIDPAGDWFGIDDSKKLSEKQRNYFYEKIIRESICYGVGVASNEEIDEINILNATKLAMKRALTDAAKMHPIDYMLIDAVKLDDIDIKQLSLVKGDQKSASIAAASILAKVTRDKMMTILHETYPQYNFDQNKGYGTQQHYDALNLYGETPKHRQSFLVKWHAQRNDKI